MASLASMKKTQTPTYIPTAVSPLSSQRRPERTAKRSSRTSTAPNVANTAGSQKAQAAVQAEASSFEVAGRLEGGVKQAKDGAGVLYEAQVIVKAERTAEPVGAKNAWKYLVKWAHWRLDQHADWTYASNFDSTTCEAMETRFWAYLAERERKSRTALEQGTDQGHGYCVEKWHYDEELKQFCAKYGRRVQKYNSPSPFVWGRDDNDW